MISETLDLAQSLIAIDSVTPDDKGCQRLIAARLEALGFKIEHLRFGEVDNLWARLGNEAPLFVFAGHTDVVPTGPLERWTHPPFEPTIVDGVLFGRGAADMKGSIAAMINACERFIRQQQYRKGSIAFLITSDEEGPAVDGTVRVIELLQKRNEHIDWCLVGEPSSVDTAGDTVKNGRRGSLNGYLTVHGTQGHIAYPHLADNPIHRFSAAMNALVNKQWDSGNAFFPPTGFQISNINAGTGASNVIPGELRVMFNLRYSTELTQETIQQRIESILNDHELDYSLKWEFSGKPFLTPGGELIEATRESIRTICGFETELSTGGGTSDGRFIAPTGAQVVELGPVNTSIHKIDENVAVAELERLSDIYHNILKILLS